MKPKVIVLCGRPDSGKTTTLGHLVKLLEKTPNKGICNIGGKTKKEVRCVVNIDGKLIGIASMGDKAMYVKRDLETFLILRCEIIVCACHPNGSSTYNAVNDLCGRYKPEFLVKKSVAKNQKETNEKQAKEILDKILETLNKISNK